MADVSWLAKEAKTIHMIFVTLFYLILGSFLLLAVTLEYFKWPLGQLPAFAPIVGRALIAAILLHTYPEVTNFLADFTDGLAQRLGDLNSFKLVLGRMGDKLGELTWSWISVKESVTLILSFITFFLLYFSVHVADAFIVYTWTLLYVFSPILIALFVFPQTAGATKALYRSLIEVSAWKIVWAVLATLVWSAALSDINKGQDISFTSAICLNLILAGSLVITPIVVHALAGSGLATLARTVGSVAVGSSIIGPAKIFQQGSELGKRTYNGGLDSASNLTKKYFPRTHNILNSAPRMNVPPAKSFFKPNINSKQRR